MKGLSIKEWLLIIVSVTIVCLLISNAVTLNEIKKAQWRIESGVTLATYSIEQDLSSIKRELSNIKTYPSQIDTGWDYWRIESDLNSIKSDLASIEQRLYSMEQTLNRIDYILRYER